MPALPPLVSLPPLTHHLDEMLPGGFQVTILWRIGALWLEQMTELQKGDWPRLSFLKSLIASCKFVLRSWPGRLNRKWHPHTRALDEMQSVH